MNWCSTTRFLTNCFSLKTVLIHEDERGKRFDHEIFSEDDKRRRRMRHLRRKAMSGSTRITNTLKKRSSQVLHCHFASISTEEILDEEEEKTVNEFRQVLIERAFLPAQHDDYHTLLRYYLHLIFFQINFWKSLVCANINIFYLVFLVYDWMMQHIVYWFEKCNRKGLIFSMKM